MPGCSTFTQIATPTTTTYSDTGLGAGSYSYRVRATDAAGNLSPYSNVATGVIPDAQPPTAPSGLTATVSGSQINLSWTASTDNVGVTGYLVERCQGASCTTFTQIATPTATTYSDTSLVVGSYSYRVRAMDAAGNLSSYSNVATGVITDTQAPTAPSGLTAGVSGSQINLSWTASTDNVGVTGYLVERCQGASCTTFTQIATPTVTTYSDTGLGAGSYSYRVRATDAAGNLSSYSNVATGVIPDTQAPTAPSGLTATVSGSQINLSWTASTDNVGVTGYLVERCQGASCTTFTQIATPTATTYSDTSLVVGSYSYRVRAMDAAGNLSSYSNVATGVITDTQAPTAPSGLTAGVSGSQINLSWTASTDNVGVTGYLVERCQGASCTTFTQIATPTVTTYSDTGLGAGSYSYRVRATDAAGNLSSYSNVATGVIPDTQAPTAPSGLSDYGEREPNQPELDSLDGQRWGDGIPGGALPGCKLHDLYPDRDHGRDDVQRHWSDGGNQLQLPGAGNRRSQQLEFILERGQRHGASHNSRSGRGLLFQRRHGDDCGRLIRYWKYGDNRQRYMDHLRQVW